MLSMVSDQVAKDFPDEKYAGIIRNRIEDTVAALLSVMVDGKQASVCVCV